MCTEAPQGMLLPCLPVGMLQGGVGPAGSLHYHTYPCATKTGVEGILVKWSFFLFFFCKTKFVLHIVHSVTYSNIQSNKLN